MKDYKGIRRIILGESALSFAWPRILVVLFCLKLINELAFGSCPDANELKNEATVGHHSSLLLA
jgi:hypothetical protein